MQPCSGADRGQKRPTGSVAPKAPSLCGDPRAASAHNCSRWRLIALRVKSLLRNCGRSGHPRRREAPITLATSSDIMSEAPNDARVEPPVRRPVRLLNAGSWLRDLPYGVVLSECQND